MIVHWECLRLPHGAKMNLDRRFDLVVLGATGLTGRLVVEQLGRRDTLSKSTVTGRLWSVAGRDPARLAKVLADLKFADVEVLHADLDDETSLRHLAMQTKVVLNCAGPYTPKSERVIEACVQCNTSYVDLSGEIPLLRRVIDRFDEAARLARVQIVQMAGWEAMPFDLTTLVACRRATADVAAEFDQHPRDVGSGSAGLIRSVHVAVRFPRRPQGGIPFNQSVSGGTLASIVEILKDPNARLVGRPESLLPLSLPGRIRQRPAPLNLWPLVKDGRVFGPVVPVAFLNPPIVYRTAAILAAEGTAAVSFANYREGMDLGSSTGRAGFKRKVAATLKAVMQKVFILATRLPLTIRRGAAQILGRLLPAPGSGPSGRYLLDWRWEVEATATTKDGRTGSAMLLGTGHPGYTATAAMICEVALHVASRSRAESRSGCLTPSLALSASGEPIMKMPTLTLK